MVGLIAGCTRPVLDAPAGGPRDISIAPFPPAATSARPLAWRRIDATIVALNYQGEAAIPEPSVEHAANVRVGEPLAVTVRTFGGGCEAAGGADGRVHGLAADLHPWDYTHMPDGPAGLEYICTVPLNVFKRTVQLVFNRAGKATIRVHGSRSHGREPTRPITLTSTVQVR